MFVIYCLPTGIHAQQTALKTNTLFWATTTPNVGVEFGITRQITLDLWGAYNAWKFSNDMKLNMYLFQPEVRYWFCRKFEGHFVGVHGHWGHFNIGQIPFISGLKDHILRGDLYGGGVTYGYHWALGERWGLEAMIGAGYAYMRYDKFRCADCGEKLYYCTSNSFETRQDHFVCSTSRKKGKGLVIHISSELLYWKKVRSNI